MNKGFTLLEVLVYVAVLGLLVGSIGTFLVWVLHVSVKVSAMGEVLSSTERAQDTISQEGRKAVSLYVPTTSASQISLETKAGLPADETSTFVDFFLCGTQLCMKREGEVPLAITSSKVEVTEFQVTQIGGTAPFKSFQVKMKIEYPNANNRPERTAVQEIMFTVAMRSS